MKLLIVKDKENNYHFKTKTNNRIDIEHKDKKLKFKLNKWGGEASVEAVLGMVEADKHTFSGNKIEVENSKRIVSVYPIDICDGGVKLKVVDKVKCQPYILTIPITAKNTRWSKQLPLTQEEKDAGTFRPEDVVNSFAIYHSTKKHNQYETGKMFHWYRTKVIDAEGNWAWCDTNVDRHIDPTEVIITAPTEFMENAAYPVIWDPDLGETGVGGSDAQVARNSPPNSWRIGSAWTMLAPGGTANYIRARVFAENASDTVDCKVFINQKDSGGAGTHAQIATKENLACAAAEHWEEFTLSGEVLTEAIVYIIDIMGDFNDLSFEQEYYLKYDNNGCVDSYSEIDTYGAPESPWVVAAEGTTHDYSIFVNYTELGWTGEISGVVNPAKIAGVAVADIAEVKGVA